eukprot:15343337-Ditylum_brightwellii.AAC.2
MKTAAGIHDHNNKDILEEEVIEVEDESDSNETSDSNEKSDSNEESDNNEESDEESVDPGCVLFRECQKLKLVQPTQSYDTRPPQIFALEVSTGFHLGFLRVNP